MKDFAMEWRSKHLKRGILAAAAICIVLPVAVKAKATTYHCKGVDYLYDSGFGQGKARRVSANRTVIIDLKGMTAELPSVDGMCRVELQMKLGAYLGFIPGQAEVFGTAVRGVVLEFLPAYSSLELKYELEDGSHYLSFTGRCR